MPAPSSMFGRQQLLLNSPHRSSSDSNVQQNPLGGNVNGHQRDSNLVPTASEGRSSTSLECSYDDIFVSKPVKEAKTMLWEIKDFETVLSNRVERAMHFEFEMGKLGSMERHLPRRSRWKIMFDMEEIGSARIPALRVIQLSPENKIIFYQLDACILKRTSEQGVQHDTETDFRISPQDYKEGLNEPNSNENVFPIQCSSSCENTADTLDQVQALTCGGSLFVKVTIEILEDAST